MTIQNIPFSDTFAFPKMVLDYLSGAETLKPFYQYPPRIDSIPRVIEAKQKEAVNREVLVQTIKEQYATMEISPEVLSNINALSGENTFCITTAHQLNIFTGPLYYIYKIACTINMCSSLKSTYPQYNFVPVYWMGSEDHDFEEINHVYVFGKKLEWADKQGGPTGHYATASVLPLIDELKTILGNLPFAEEWIELLEKSYAHKTLDLSARYLVNALFGQYGLVVVDGNCHALKNEFRPVMEDELLHQVSCKLVNEELEKLSAAGYKQQAFPREINLFYLSEKSRERIVYENGQYKVQNTGLVFSQAEILQELKTFPGKFSPNVILRPLFQQKILPSLAYVGGGGELSYWLQLKTVFEHSRVNFPQLMLRNSVLWLNKNQQAKMEKLGCNTRDLFLEPEKLKKSFVLRASGEVSFEEERREIISAFEKVQDKASAIDATLVNAIGAELQKTLQGIENTEKRLLKALKQKNETELNQLEKLKLQLFPDGKLQERHENFSALYATHGKAILGDLVHALDPYGKEFLIFSE